MVHIRQSRPQQYSQSYSATASPSLTLPRSYCFVALLEYSAVFKHFPAWGIDQLSPVLCEAILPLCVMIQRRAAVDNLTQISPGGVHPARGCYTVDILAQSSPRGKKQGRAVVQYDYRYSGSESPRGRYKGAAVQ